MAAVVIAASHSGAGKTTVTGVVLSALRRRGLTVQAFKLGPDFIDPAYHTEAAGRPAINLDLWMMGIDGVRESFQHWAHDADVSVIEAMGALHDGADGTDHGSAADLAKLLGLPVIVVLDVWGMTRTTAAIIDGLIRFDPDVDVAGCILNRVGSTTHAEMILNALPEQSHRLVLGTIHHRPELAITERHLGLTTVQENPVPPPSRDVARIAAGDGLDVDRIISIARSAASALPTPASPTRSSRRGRHRRLAVAVDSAFCFYYEENLALLREAGFELVPFRPTEERQLPAGTAAVYLGGGYPECFLQALAGNRSLAAELRDQADAGMPMYAECGGLMYLARSVTSVDAARHDLVGVLPIDIVMDPTHLAIRYVEITTRVQSPLGPAGTAARGQEFHQSRIDRADIEPNLYDATTSTGVTTRDGYLVGNVAASYVHLHLRSNRGIAYQFMAAAGIPDQPAS